MTVLNFPNNPTDRQLFPVNITPEQIQYIYNSSKNAWLVNSNAPDGLSAPTLVVTSTTSNTLSIGIKAFNFTQSSPTGFYLGQRLRAVNNINNYMEGIINQLTTNSLTLNIDYIQGTGTFNSWTIGVTGDIPDLEQLVQTSSLFHSLLY